ncbi:MAG TPA: DnaJ domain-containing protein, partial [Myxococcota bacterium]|nr:DnaJ domain-containing protein [Myxococcota bacterium]
EHELQFSAGVPVACKSSASKSGLCDPLAAAGALAANDRARVESLIRSKRCTEAAALLELGLITPRAILIALRDQLRARLLECMAWPRGAFTRDASARSPEAANPFQIDVYAVAQAGITAHWRADQVLSALEPKLERYASKGAQFGLVLERLEPDDALAAFVSALDGSHTLWEALKLASTPSSLAAAWVLDAALALEYRTDADGEQAKPEVELELVFTDSRASRSEQVDAGAARAEATRLESSAAAALREEIIARFEKLDALDHYQLLGVAANAKPAEIKSAYRLAAKTYHPDALTKAGLDAETRQKANKVFALISKAHAVLSNAKRRSEYDIARSSSEGPIDAERLANAETLYRKGEVLLRAGNFSGALVFLRSAVDLWPDEADYRAALGWGLHRNHPSDPVLAREHLARAVELAPENARAIQRLSLVVRSLGEIEEADRLLARARAIDPKLS